MIQLPCYILPKVEIITSYGCRGFRSFKNEERVSSEVFAEAMCVYTELGKSFLDMYSSNNSCNDVVEVCSPRWKWNYSKRNLQFELFHRGLIQGRFNCGKLRMKESSICFWFQKKFPRIALWCLAEPGNHFDNMVLDFKLNVLINGNKQLTSSCQYILYAKETDQMLCCDLQCNVEGNVEGVFSDNDWNHVEILCEMEHLMPCDSKRVMAHRNWTTKRMLKWSLMYVYPDEEEGDFNLFDDLDSPLSKKQKFLDIWDTNKKIQEMQRIIERVLKFGCITPRLKLTISADDDMLPR
jgi:hypothetical protein